MKQKGINRRQFLKYSAAMGTSLAFSDLLSSCTWSELEGVRIVDPHAHPDQFYLDNPTIIDRTSTLESITELGMVASSFAAVGDIGSNFYLYTKYQLSKAQALVDEGKVNLVLKTSDIPYSIECGGVPGAILSIEGGDPLEGNADRVDEFYGLGVRIITLVHNRDNEL
ncbi:MAG TPA: membrane dipeptidase, partial [Nitrospiria bacterium]|nr:membrane dipeptidase [Nitrospiria bacterium]